MGGVDVLYSTDILEQAEQIERLAHKVLALSGEHIRGKRFVATLDDAIAAIEPAIEQAGGKQLPLGGKLKKFQYDKLVEPGIPLQIRFPADFKRELKRLQMSSQSRFQ